MNELSSRLGLLRAIKPEELELMLSWRNAPSVRVNMYSRHEISLDEHLQWWARTRSRVDQKYFMYECQGAPLGIVAFSGIDTASRNSSWAFYASPQAPKGTGSRMEYLALECAFNELQLHKLCCEVLAFNSSVIKLHQKFGFKVEGILREQHRLEKAFVDVYRLGILAPEWSSQQEEMQEKLLKLSTA
ncbi:UDP-4-amino-4,6-dideoxy-N-acetyl-beta-L-altrosamine N-acetyltransferase [Stutzerimonas balearica]|uniref:UDP-4-amino-4, 6-dideoxy-N-acetyl-beta-L-altrosamine N-acetyltransferase n=1 Tax=Stutzerimonas balearica TaxID=74829 RepID=UPI001BC9BB0A|nr:UDP-4-amino-4,6-dideoxy-N-acetyl-beta-L-altrosamine N-acetyltransferase [Stutzerimonas balearica]MBS4151426.1 UDP-4-amino-4,6-dideoxy-N-acetyl-beta-L-altrosamine N-acetyltransferase [Stutzerimonas balearica]